MINGMFLFDYFLFKRFVFYVIVGLLFGILFILKVLGQIDEWIEVGDIIIELGVDGCVEVVLKINVVKFYVGIGFGCLVVYLCVGFKFELGVMFYGNLKIEVIIGKIVEEVIDQDLSCFNKFLKNFKVYFVFNFQLLYWIF